MDKQALGKAARETLVEYFQMTSLNGFGLLYYIRRRKYQRLLWSMFILLGSGFATYVVAVTLLSFLVDPTVTILANKNYPIWTTPMPAVAICSANKLSRRSVEAYIEQKLLTSALLNLPYNQYEYWVEKMKLFAGYFDSYAVDVDKAIDFQSILNSLESDFNVATTLNGLAPRCNELLIRCRWAGDIKKCGDLFKMAPTVHGHCCIFNYQRGESAHSLYHPNGIGVEMGLTILLNTSTTDYYYTPQNNMAYVMQIFSANNFPDATTGGGIEELFIDANQDVDIQLALITQETSREIQGYSMKQRRCHFENDNIEEYNMVSYSQSECFHRCKIDSMIALCGCIPYYTPASYTFRNSTPMYYCTLAHIECLARYRVTWSTYHPTELVQKIPPNFVKELQEALRCENCLPLCSYKRYDYRRRVNRLSKTLRLAENQKFLANYNGTNDVSIIKLYFETEFGTQYRKNLLYNWYQIISNIGGVIGICIGCSLISGFEIIYFLTYRLFKNYQKFRMETNKS